MRVLLAAACLVVGTITVPAGAETIALRCGNVFDSKTARLVGARTIVATDGRVREMLPAGAVVPDATEIDLAGQTCMPGWIDLHVHLSEQQSPDSYLEELRLNPTDFAYRSVGFAEKTLLAGFTTVRDLGGLVSISLRNAINQGLIKGPRIYTAGKIIASTGGHGDPRNGLNDELAQALGPPGPIEGVVNGVDEARQAVRQRYKEG